MKTLGIDVGLQKFHLCVTCFKKNYIPTERLAYGVTKKLVRNVKFFIPNLDAKYFANEFFIHKEKIDYYRYYIQERLLRRVLSKERPDIAVLESPIFYMQSAKRYHFNYIYMMIERILFENDIPFYMPEPLVVRQYSGAKEKEDSVLITKEDFKFIEDDDQADSFLLSCYGFSYYGLFKGQPFIHRILGDLYNDSIYAVEFKV